METSKVRRAVLSTIVCNTLVWYDYILFGSLASTIGNLFFPMGDGVTRLISSFCVFAVGFCMRPFGAGIFGHIGDRYGRRVALVVSIAAMSVPMGFMAVIPTYESAGAAAAVLLVICRLIQGFSLGGESGNATFLIEHSKSNRAGLFGSFEVLSAVLGSVFALTVKMLSEHLTGGNFFVWGWRIPFVIGFIIGIISIIMRLKTGESPAFAANTTRKGGVIKSPVKHLFKNYKRPLILAICIDCIENCSFHIFMVFFANYVRNFSSLSAEPLLAEGIEAVIVCICGILTVAFGALSDVLGRKKVMMTASAALFVFAIPVFWLLSQQSIVCVAAGYLLFAIPFAATLGPSSAAMSELFPTKVRYTGFGMARNISSAFGGGLAPVLCAWLMKSTGLAVSPGFCVMFWALVAFVALKQITKHDIYRDWAKK
ncbi:MAG: MFS transporter [Aaplasma endosymbiont of Hyalomma asiaticum]